MFTSIVVLCVLCVIAAVSMVVLLWKHYQMLDEIDVLNDEIDSFSSEMDELSNNYEAIIAKKEHDHAKFMEWAKQQVDELKANHEAEIARWNEELSQACEDYLSLSNEYEPMIAQKDAEIAALKNPPEVKCTTKLFQGIMPTQEMDAALRLIIVNNKNYYSGGAIHWRPSHSDLLSEMELWPTDSGSDMLAAKGISEMIRDKWLDGIGPYHPTPKLIERIMHHDSLRRLAMKNFAYKFPDKYNHIDYPKDDDTRDLPAVDSEFTLPNVDDEPLLYRGLMGNSEMEDAVKAMVGLHGPYLTTQCVNAGCFKKGSEMTGIYLLHKNGWIEGDYPHGFFKPKQSLIERICTRPELAAKIGKGEK